MFLSNSYFSSSKSWHFVRLITNEIVAYNNQILTERNKTKMYHVWQNYPPLKCKPMPRTWKGKHWKFVKKYPWEWKNMVS